MSESLKVWMSESLTVWKFESLKVWMPESLKVWMSESLKVWPSEYLNIWKSESLTVWTRESLNVWMSESLNARMSECLKSECLNAWKSEGLNVWKSESLALWISEYLKVWQFERVKVWMSQCLKVWMSELLEFEGGLARNLPLHIFNCWNFKVSHESFPFTSSTGGIWRRSRTKVSFSHLQLLEFEGGLARKRPFHIFKSWNSKGVSHESFLFTSSTGGIWMRSRTKVSFSHLQLLEFEGGLTRKFPFRIFNWWNLKEVSHEMHLWELAMHEMLCFAGQNVSRMMCGEACPPDGLGTRSFRVGSFSKRPRHGTASSAVTFTSWTLKI